jgi:hypothetical protein
MLKFVTEECHDKIRSVGKHVINEQRLLTLDASFIYLLVSEGRHDNACDSI